MAEEENSQQPNADDLLKIVLTRSDLLELEKKCNIGELFDICDFCLARVHLHNTNMISTIGDILHEMQIQNVQFGKRLILTYLGFFELDQISEELPSSDELEAFLAKGKDQIPISRLTREFMAEKWKSLIKILGATWWRKRIGYEIEEGELIEDDEEEMEEVEIGIEMAANIKIENAENEEEQNNEEKENKAKDDDANKKKEVPEKPDIKKEYVEMDFGTDFPNSKRIDDSFNCHASTSSSGVETSDSPLHTMDENEPTPDSPIMENNNNNSSSKGTTEKDDDDDFVQLMGEGEPIDEDIGLNKKGESEGGIAPINVEEIEKGCGREEEEEDMEGSKQKDKEQEIRDEANKADEVSQVIQQNVDREMEGEKEAEIMDEPRPSTSLEEMDMEIEEEEELDYDEDEHERANYEECQKTTTVQEGHRNEKETRKTVKFMEPLIVTEEPSGPPIEKEKGQEEIIEEWRELAKLVISYTSLDNLHSLGGLDAEMAAKGCWVLFKMNGTQKPIIDAIVDISEESITFKHWMAMERRTLSDFMDGVTEKVFQDWKMDMKQWEEPIPTLAYLRTKRKEFYDAFAKAKKESKRKRKSGTNTNLSRLLGHLLKRKRKSDTSLSRLLGDESENKKKIDSNFSRHFGDGDESKRKKTNFSRHFGDGDESERKRNDADLSRLLGNETNPGEAWKIFVNTDQLRQLIKLGISKFQEITLGLLIQCRITNKAKLHINPEDDWIMPITRVEFAHDEIMNINVDHLWAARFRIAKVGDIRNPLAQYGEPGWETTRTTANSQLMERSLRKYLELGIYLPSRKMIERKHTELVDALKMAENVAGINYELAQMDGPKQKHYFPEQMATASDVNYTPGVPMAYRPNWQRDRKFEGGGGQGKMKMTPISRLLLMAEPRIKNKDIVYKGIQKQQQQYLEESYQEHHHHQKQRPNFLNQDWPGCQQTQTNYHSHPYAYQAPSYSTSSQFNSADEFPSPSSSSSFNSYPSSPFFSNNNHGPPHFGYPHFGDINAIPSPFNNINNGNGNRLEGRVTFNNGTRFMSANSRHANYGDPNFNQF